METCYYKLASLSTFNSRSLLFSAPRQQRMCLSLAWNELDTNVLAIGHDRYRSDSCITIWDIEHGLPKESGEIAFFFLTTVLLKLCQCTFRSKLFWCF